MVVEQVNFSKSTKVIYISKIFFIRRTMLGLSHLLIVVAYRNERLTLMCEMITDKRTNEYELSSLVKERKKEGHVRPADGKSNRLLS